MLNSAYPAVLNSGIAFTICTSHVIFHDWLAGLKVKQIQFSQTIWKCLDLDLRQKGTACCPRHKTRRWEVRLGLEKACHTQGTHVKYVPHISSAPPKCHPYLTQTLIPVTGQSVEIFRCVCVCVCVPACFIHGSRRPHQRCMVCVSQLVICTSPPAGHIVDRVVGNDNSNIALTLVERQLEYSSNSSRKTTQI